MKYLFSRYKSGVTLSQFLPNSSQLAIVLSPIVQFCTKMAGERSSSEPPQEDSKGLRSEVGLCLTSSNWACPTMVEMYPMIQYVTRRDPNKFPRQNDDNGHQNFNAHDVDANDNIWSECQWQHMIRGGFPIKINGYALGSQENLAEGCREVIIAFFSL